MQLYDGMRTDVGSLMIECSVTICDALNKDESTPSVGSTQLLLLLAAKIPVHYQYKYTYKLPNITPPFVYKPPTYCLHEFAAEVYLSPIYTPPRPL